MASYLMPNGQPVVAISQIKWIRKQAVASLSACWPCLLILAGNIPKALNELSDKGLPKD